MIQRNIDMIDPEIYDLLTYINRVEGIRTTGSCVGHNERPCMVCCEADSIATVHKFMRDYFYNDELWTIRLYITDTLIDDNDWDKVVFVIQSDARYIDFPTVNLMVNNLTYRFWKHQNYDTSRLLLPVDNSIKLEDAIREDIVKEYRENKELNPKTSHWEDSSNGWLCYACKRDSSSAYKICPNCKRKMRNGYVEYKEKEE